MSKKFYYFPILKTTSAELKAYNFLDSAVQNTILPIFELTKSRKTTNNLESKLEKKIDKLYEIVSDKPFIIDLTTETTYSNKEIERMIYDGSNGYKNWVDFIKNQKEKFPSIIPMIHYHPEKSKEVKKQIISLGKICSNLAFRVDVFQEETSEYIKEVLTFCNQLQSSHKTMIILDSSFISIAKTDRINEFKKRVKKIVNDNKENNRIGAFIYAFSSFPKSVTDKGYDGGDSYGEFPITESRIQQLLLPSKKLYHGDYGSIHPKRYDTGGGGWIPRIDVVSASEESFFYHRYRRDEGSYTLCAKKVLQNEKYSKITQVKAWGDEEIEYAGQGQPRGKSPSHWIAVRSNLYMTKQYFRLKKANKYLSLSW